MLDIALVQPNFQVGPKEYNSYYLPYSVGILWAFSLTSQKVKDNYQLKKFVWRRDPIEDTAAGLANCAVVGFSTYNWNRNYNYALAERIKKINPNCIIVFGGPEPPITKADIFQRHPYIDCVVKQEGEHAFKGILESLDDYSYVPGLLLNKNGQAIDTGTAIRIDNLDQLPSPYLTGVFDQLLQEHPNIKWCATLESNRGCPYACTFCDWGSLTYSKIKKFDLNRVLDEMQWMAENHIDFIMVADANFGIFYDRDLKIAQKLIEIQRNYGHPNSYSLSYAKNQNREVINICKLLVDNGSRVGLTVSVQSLDDAVLTNIKRKNLAINDIEKIFNICDKEDIPVFTELILGLPGETLTTWKENFWQLFRANNHTGITVYLAQLLENAELNLLQKRLYKIETKHIKDYIPVGDNNDEFVETVELVCSTKDMPYYDMISALMFSYYINTFHINGITNILARFAYEYAGVDYKEFYDKLLAYIEHDAWWQQEWHDTRQYYYEWFEKGEINHPDVGSVKVFGMNLAMRTSFAIQQGQRYNYVFNLVQSFYQTTFSEHRSFYQDLFALQKSYYIDYDKIHTYPIEIKTKYNVLGFIQHRQNLYQPAIHKFDFPEDKNMPRELFCENIWFARRRNFGKATLSY